VAGGCGKPAPPRFENLTIGGHSFRLELAVTPVQIRTGMMGRNTVGEKEGMLFIFPDERHRHFWMKGCLIPLDVVFVDGDGRIVAIHTMSVPDPGAGDSDLPTYPSRWPAQFAIELRAGRAGELKLKEGDKLDWPLERIRKWAHG
jgi:uncharacterized protein